MAGALVASRRVPDSRAVTINRSAKYIQSQKLLARARMGLETAQVSFARESFSKYLNFSELLVQ